MSSSCVSTCHETLGNSKKRAHCSTCHHTFTAYSNFDRHLDGMDPVVHRHPTDTGLELKANGCWGQPAPPAEQMDHWNDGGAS